jgi:hypothetical protein
LSFFINHAVTEESIARQLLDKHCVKAEIAAEAEVILLGNGASTFPRQRILAMTFSQQPTE